MSLKIIVLCLSSLILINTAQAKATELDQYLLKKKILDQTYKIKNTKALNEILDVMSDEDSRTMPYQVDQNTVIEQLRLYADHIDIQGIITTPDFTQFAEDIGDKQVKHLIKQNLIQIVIYSLSTNFNALILTMSTLNSVQMIRVIK